MTSDGQQSTSKPKRKSQRGAPGVKRRRYGYRNAAQDELLLAALRKGDTIEHACEVAGYAVVTCKTWRKDDPAFEAAVQEAREVGTGALIAEARRRGAEGVDEPVFHKGEVCGHVRKYSDSLLMFLIKQRDPSFRENFTVNGTVEHRHVHEVVLRGANERAMRMATEARGLLPAPREPGE